MASFRIALADALIQRNQPGEACIELGETISSLLRLLEQRLEMLLPHDLLALGYSGLAMVLRQAGQRNQARAQGREGTKRHSLGALISLHHVSSPNCR